MDGLAVFSILVDQPVFIGRSCTPLSGDFSKWGVGGLFTEKQTDFTISLLCQVCCWHNSTGYPGFLLEKSGPIKRADSVSSLLLTEHPRISVFHNLHWPSESNRKDYNCSLEGMQPRDLRADRAGYNTPFAGVLQLLALTSWHCHHKCPADFGLDTCISLTNIAETNPRWGTITAVVYLPFLFIFLEQVWSYVRWESWDMDVLTERVCICACQHTPMREDGRGQQRVVCLFICSKLLQVGAIRISTVLLHCTQVT